MKVFNLPTKEGRALGHQMARFCDAEAPAYHANHPASKERCATCAFREGTLPNGCATTLMDAMKCIMEGDVFLCHEHPETPCVGYSILKLSSANRPPNMTAPWPYSDEVGESTITKETTP